MCLQTRRVFLLFVNGFVFFVIVAVLGGVFIASAALAADAAAVVEVVVLVVLVVVVVLVACYCYC